MTTPHEALLDWYDCIPDSRQEDLAVDVVFHIPNLPRLDEYESTNELMIIGNSKQIFESWLRDTSGSPKQVATKILFARTLISFYALRHQTPERWEQIVEDHKEMIEEFAAAGQIDLAELSRKVIERAPLRKTQWEDVIDDWEKRCETYLSDDAIALWLRLKGF